MSTPFLGDTATPSSAGDTVVDASKDLTEEKLQSVDTKLERRKSFGKAQILDNLPTRSASDGLTKEHSEHGRVKGDVYFRYIEAASKTGFSVFVICIVLSQVTSVLGNNTLRAWGEHNLSSGSNKDAFWYLLMYGLYSLASTLLGTVAAITLWVFCSVRSSRLLHDSVRRLMFSMTIH